MRTRTESNNASSHPYRSWLESVSAAAAKQSPEEIAEKKIAAAYRDPFAAELALRLAVAETSLMLGDSFQSSYKRFCSDTNEVGSKWISLVIVVLEDKAFGDGGPTTIFRHPVVNEFPALRNTAQARTNRFTVAVARRFQAAFDSMNIFEPGKPRNRGISTFERHLRRIQEPQDLWIVVANLNGLFPKSPLG